MKKKFNKKLLLFLLPVLAIGLVVAGAIYFHSVNVTGTIGEPLSSETIEVDLTAYPGESIMKSVLIENDADVNYDIVLNWIEKSNMILMDNLEGTCDNYPEPNWREECEKRIVLDGMALSELTSISWDADVITGYTPHIDLRLDNGKSLTFEYAKVDPSDCDDVADYPIGEINTFGDKGIVDADAYAWESIPGPCGNTAFDLQHKNLADWKALYPTATITAIEIEIDNWISPSSSYLGNIKVNGERIDSQLYGVSYSIETLTQIANPGSNNIEISIDYSTDSPIGLLEGTLGLSRA